MTMLFVSCTIPHGSKESRKPLAPVERMVSEKQQPEKTENEEKATKMVTADGLIKGHRSQNRIGIGKR